MFDDQDREVIDKIDDILNVYGFQEILELNDLTVAEALYIMWTEGMIELPDVRPV